MKSSRVFSPSPLSTLTSPFVHPYPAVQISSFSCQTSREPPAPMPTPQPRQWPEETPTHQGKELVGGLEAGQQRTLAMPALPRRRRRARRPRRLTRRPCMFPRGRLAGGRGGLMATRPRPCLLPPPPPPPPPPLCLPRGRSVRQGAPGHNFFTRRTSVRVTPIELMLVCTESYVYVCTSCHGAERQSPFFGFSVAHLVGFLRNAQCGLVVLIEWIWIKRG